MHVSGFSLRKCVYFYRQRSKTRRSITLKCTEQQQNGRLRRYAIRLEAHPAVKDCIRKKGKKAIKRAMAQRDDGILGGGGSGSRILQPFFNSNRVLITQHLNLL